MIEHPAPAGIFLTGNVDAGLLIKPPVGKPEVIGNLAGLLQDDAVWLEHRIDITGHASSVVSQGHRGTANHEDIRHDATTDTTPRRTKRSPRAVNARSISARPRRTSSGSVTQ